MKIDFKKHIIKRKYYILTTIFFIIWIGFVDSNSLLVIYDLRKKLSDYRQEKEIFTKQFISDSIEYDRLIKNKAEIEKYARENYFFKKKNEDVFIVIEK